MLEIQLLERIARASRSGLQRGNAGALKNARCRRGMTRAYPPARCSSSSESAPDCAPNRRSSLQLDSLPFFQGSAQGVKRRSKMAPSGTSPRSTKGASSKPAISGSSSHGRSGTAGPSHLADTPAACCPNRPRSQCGKRRRRWRRPVEVELSRRSGQNQVFCCILPSTARSGTKDAATGVLQHFLRQRARNRQVQPRRLRCLQRARAEFRPCCRWRSLRSRTRASRPPVRAFWIL